MILNASYLEPDRRIHALLIGPSGSGKTAAALSFPGRTHILDFDDRAKGPLLGCKWLQEKRLSGEVEINRILRYTDKKANGYNEVFRELESLDTRVSKNEVENVILDSTTSMRKFFVDESRDGIGEVRHHKIGQVELSQKQDYNYAATAITNVIYQNLKTFKCNVFISTHFRDKLIASPTPEEPDRVVSAGQTITVPGQLQVEVPSWFDEVWEFQVDDTIKSSPPRRFVVFQSAFAHTSFQLDKHRLEITDRSLYEILKPTLEKMKGAAK